MNVPEGYELDNDAVSGLPAGYEVDQEQSPVESAARGALRNFPLAQQVAAAAAPINPLSDKSNYTDEMAHLTDAAEQGKAQNPKSYLAGAAAGALAPLAIPGAGEALEAAPILGNAAFGAAGSASDANLTKPTARDLGNAALGAGIGGTLGAVGKGLQALAPSAEQLAASSTAKGLGATARNVGKVMGENPDASMNELGQWINTAKTTAGEPLFDLTTRPGKFMSAVQDVHDDAGDKIGSVIDHLSKKLPVSVTRLKQELTPILDDVADINPTAETKVAGIFKRLDKLEDSGRLDFDSLQKLKSSIGKNIGEEPAMERAYGAVAGYMDQVIDAYGQLVKDPAIKAGYDSAKIDYRNASRILPILRRAEGRELASGPVGNSGLLGLFGLASGVASGHPVGGAAAALASAVGRPLANLGGRNLALKAVPAMPAIAAAGRGLSRAAQMELEDALTSKFGTKKP